MMKLDAISRESSDPATRQLQDRLSQVQDRLSERGAKLDAMKAKVESLGDNVKALEMWIVNVVQGLQGEPQRLSICAPIWASV